MKGKEIVDICTKHELCDDCELEGSEACKQIMEEMEHGVPSTILYILKQEYRGDKV